MADFSDTALENVKTQDLGEIGELISNVVGELKDFDVQEEGKFFGFFRKQTSKIENLKTNMIKHKPMWRRSQILFSNIRCAL